MTAYCDTGFPLLSVQPKLHVTETKCTLDTLKAYCKPRSNEIVAARTYKQLVQEELSLPEYIEKYKEVTAACKFGIAYDKS